jgi:hypothetical protein
MVNYFAYRSKAHTLIVAAARPIDTGFAAAHDDTSKLVVVRQQQRIDGGRDGPDGVGGPVARPASVVQVHMLGAPNSNGSAERICSAS